MTQRTVVLLNNKEGRELVVNSCQRSGFLFDEFEKLVQAQIEHSGNAQRRQLFAAFDDILDRIKLEEE
ncbi:MAG: hypothetical protein ACR2P7_03505 [bacterium]